MFEKCSTLLVTNTAAQSGTRKSGAETFAPLEAVFLAAAFG